MIWLTELVVMFSCVTRIVKRRTQFRLYRQLINMIVLLLQNYDISSKSLALWDWWIVNIVQIPRSITLATLFVLRPTVTEIIKAIANT